MDTTKPDAAQEAIFDQGHEIGALAKIALPLDGLEVSADVTDLGQVLQKSLEVVKQRKPLFEAGFVYNDGFGSFRFFLANASGGEAGLFPFSGFWKFRIELTWMIVAAHNHERMAMALNLSAATEQDLLALIKAEVREGKSIE